VRLIVVRKSEVPLVQQLYDEIKAQVLSGQLRGGECLPSIRKIANELTISVITVKNAYQRLEEDGYIYTRPGSGCFVSENLATDGRYDALLGARQSIEYCKKCGCDKQELMQIINEIFD
jgi:GntR family transcriptional regulator